MKQLEHLKKNYLWTILFMVGMGILAIFTTREEDVLLKIFLPITFFTIALIIIPIGNYYSWKKKFKK